MPASAQRAANAGSSTDGVAVVDAIDAQHLDRGPHVGPRHAELACVGGGLQAGAARRRVRGGEELGRTVDLAVVDADADDLVDPVLDDPADHLERGRGLGLAVDRRHEPADDAVLALGVADRANDRRQRLGVGDARVACGPGRVPEELAVADVVRGRVLEVFEGDPLQIVGRLHQQRIERAQDAQDADRLGAAGIERLDLGRRDRRAGTPHQVLEGGAAHRAEQMAMQLDLRQRVQEGVETEARRAAVADVDTIGRPMAWHGTRAWRTPLLALRHLRRAARARSRRPLDRALLLRRDLRGAGGEERQKADRGKDDLSTAVASWIMIRDPRTDRAAQARRRQRARALGPAGEALARSLQFATVRILLVSDLHYTLPQLDWVVRSAPSFDLVVLAGDQLDIARACRSTPSRS